MNIKEFKNEMFNTLKERRQNFTRKEFNDDCWVYENLSNSDPYTYLSNYDLDEKKHKALWNLMSKKVEADKDLFVFYDGEVECVGYSYYSEYHHELIEKCAKELNIDLYE